MLYSLVSWLSEGGGLAHALDSGHLVSHPPLDVATQTPATKPEVRKKGIASSCG